MKKLELVLLAILGGFALTFLVLSREYSSTAALFPRLIAVASLLFLVLGRMVRTSRIRPSPGASRHPLPKGEGHVEDLPSPSGRGWREAPGEGRILDVRTILALQAGYVAFIYLLGFFVATLLYLILAPIQLRYQRRGVAIATSVVLTLLLAGSFMWLFDIQLPAGAIWEML